MNQFVAFTDRAHALAAAGARADALFGNSSSPTSNPQTRRTYGCSITEFLAWCEQNGLASIIDRAAIWGMSVECTHGPDRRQRSRTPARFLQEGMDTAYLSALAALACTAVGGLTSFFSSWLGQSAQLKAQLFLQEKDRRQELYRDFVDEASRFYIDALTNDQPDLSKTIALYALVSRMRILSSSKVVEEADKVARLIVDFYPKPNKTFSELRAMMDEDLLDPLRSFSESCREELQELAPSGWRISA